MAGPGWPDLEQLIPAAWRLFPEREIFSPEARTARDAVAESTANCNYAGKEQGDAANETVTVAGGGRNFAYPLIRRCTAVRSRLLPIRQALRTSGLLSPAPWGILPSAPWLRSAATRL